DIPGDLTDAFDIVSAFDVFFHIVDDKRVKRALENISGMLRPGGFLLFSDLFLHHTTERRSHVVARRLEEVEDVLLKSGFRIISRRPMFVVMNEPLDNEVLWLRTMWQALMLPVRCSEAIGRIWGAALFPIDFFLTKILSESPSIEIKLCQKVS